MDVQLGKDVARVKDLIYDPATRSVFAFLADDKGFFAGASIIYLEDIDTIGKDRILMKSGLAMREASGESKRLSGVADTARGINKTFVMSESGTRIGQVTDFSFSVSSGSIESFDLVQRESGKLEKGITIAKDDIKVFGEDCVIVKKIVEDMI